ncbi:NAD-dependent epimerase/dehydratase family protein [Cumulibacter soli]|uniref:NAD-dependent epimerase/dehydratase family protein n=1 Tax=Cumulibacter soli TaxID=2546344 RepID=UPI00106874E9|nr:NAD-dependent epimerase/dehydratase family protein [Cumulibacter soli]
MRRKIAVVGASGLIGTAAIERLLTAGHQILAISRRSPEIDADGDITHVPLDLMDADACRDILSAHTDIDTVVYAAVYEEPGLIAGWRSTAQMQTNLAMLRNVMQPLLAGGSLEQVVLMQGTKAYGAHIHPIRVPARERFPRDEHENFYWLQEDWIREAADKHDFTWTIFRPTVVLGPNTGVVMNLIPVIGLYGVICRETGRPFGYPGHVSRVQDAVDTRVIAGAIEWSLGNERAAGEHFNLTNGEVFSWPDLWPSVADTLGVPFAEQHPTSISEFLPTQEPVWADIVRKYELRPTRIADLVGESHYYADALLGYGAKKPAAPSFLSSVKIMQAGFTEVYDTEQSVCHWLRVLQDRHILPPP